MDKTTHDKRDVFKYTHFEKDKKKMKIKHLPKEICSTFSEY